MSVLSPKAIGMAAAVAGLCISGYCVYFDHKRRSDPEFKNKLKEKRRSAKHSKKKGGQTVLPDFNNPEAMQKFFLSEVQKGEVLLADGEIEEGVDHLSNAVAVCGQPEHLLQVLQQTLPPNIFGLLVQKLQMKRMAGAGAEGPMMMGGMGGMGAQETGGAVIDEVVD